MHSHLPFAALLLVSLILYAAPAAGLLRLAQADDRYSHTAFMPLLAAAVVSLQFDRSGRFPRLAPPLAVAFLMGSAGLRVATASSSLTIQISALVAVWTGAFLICYGRAALKTAGFSVLLLLLAIPPPVALMDRISAILQSVSAAFSHELFRLLGVPVFRQGNTLALPGLTVEVAEQCSGIRSTVALVITGLLAGYFLLRSPSARLALVLATALAAILKNAVRIVFLSSMAVYVDEGILHGTLHHSYGGTVFSLVAVALIAPVLWILRRAERTASHLPVSGGS